MLDWIARERNVPLSEAEAEKINWKKVGEKIAGIGQAAANLGAIRNLFLDDDEVGVEGFDWRQGPWIVHHPGGLRGFAMSDADAERSYRKKKWPSSCANGCWL